MSGKGKAVYFWQESEVARLRLSVEEYAGMNFIMNLMAVSFGARLAGHLRWRRAAAASLLGTAYALAARALPGSAMGGAIGQAVCLVAMTAVAVGERKRPLNLRAGGCILAGALLMGGVCQILARWLPRGSFRLAIGAGAVVAMVSAFLRRERSRRVGQARLRLRVGTRMGEVELNALLDTGNQLFEPLSGLPVLVAEKTALQWVLDPECLNPRNRLPPGFRLVQYQGLGGGGMLRCFRPAELQVWRGGRWADCPQAWVAVYPGLLGEGIQALAPPAFESDYAAG